MDFYHGLLGWVAAAALVVIQTSLAAADEPGAGERREKVLAQAREALVRVELFLKQPADDEDGPGGLGETSSAQSLDRQQEWITRFKMPAQYMGVVVSPRELVVPDAAIDPRRIDRWEVTDATGRKTIARRSAILLDAPALVLEPNDPEANWTPPKFADAALTPTSVLTLVAPQWSARDLNWVLATGTSTAVSDWGKAPAAAKQPASSPFWLVGSLRLGPGQGDGGESGEPPTAAPSLIFSAAGELLGVGLADRVRADSRVPPWRAADLRAAARITPDEWDKIRDRTREAFRPALYPVRIEYRRPKGVYQAIPDSELLGWAVTDRVLLIPGGMPRQVAVRIAKIMVQSRDTEVEASFVGQVRDFDAILIRLNDDVDPLPAHTDLARAGELRLYRPHIGMTIARRYGANDLRVDYARVPGWEYVYGNRLSPRLTPAPPIGSLVLDLDGNPIGVFARQRRPYEEVELFEQFTQTRQRPNLSSSVELFDLAQIAAVVAKPGEHIDPRVVRRDEKDQDRRAWLGIESNPLTRELAESLGCRKESKDGTIGLMISQIYAGSPAEQLGLRSGDVLFSLELPDREQPIRLRPPPGFGPRGGFDPSQFGGEGGQTSARAPWPSRMNYLTLLLSTIGEGTPLKVTFWRDGKIEHAQFTVTQAPPDQDSATQFKDERVGITLKEVTYEVRAALNMKPDDPGVVVAKIESGSPAARARISPFEIVQSADGEPIDSPNKFEEVIRKATDEKKEQIRLVVVDRGRQRFADLKLGQ